MIYVLKRIGKLIIIWFKFHKKLRLLSSCSISFESDFEGANKIYPHTSFSGKMGYGSYIGPNCDIKATIGRFTSIAPFVRTNLGIHPITFPYATTSPMFFSNKRQTGETFADRLMFDETRPPTIIGNDVWIGENVFFAGGLTIGDGAVVLAGAVVTKDIPPYAIVGGIPAKVIKYRFDEETITFLLNLRWWDMDVSWLKEHWELLCDINKLKSYFNLNSENE